MVPSSKPGHICPLCQDVAWGVKCRGREDGGGGGGGEDLTLAEFQSLLGASLASTGGTIWVLNVPSRKCAWTPQPKFSPISYNLFGQSGFCHELLAPRAPFAPGSLWNPGAWVSDRILSTLGLGAPLGQGCAFETLSGVSSI